MYETIPASSPAWACSSGAVRRIRAPSAAAFARVPCAGRFRRRRLGFLPELRLRRQRGTGRSRRPVAARGPPPRRCRRSSPRGRRPSRKSQTFFNTSAKNVLKAIAGGEPRGRVCAICCCVATTSSTNFKAARCWANSVSLLEDEVRSSWAVALATSAQSIYQFKGVEPKIKSHWMPLHLAGTYESFARPCCCSAERFHLRCERRRVPLQRRELRRDVQLTKPNVHDLRNVVAGDASPDGKGTLELCRGIEVGHIFSVAHQVFRILASHLI